MFVEKEFLITSIVKLLKTLDTTMLEGVYRSLKNISKRRNEDGLQERNRSFIEES